MKRLNWPKTLLIFFSSSLLTISFELFVAHDSQDEGALEMKQYFLENR